MYRLLITAKPSQVNQSISENHSILKPAHPDSSPNNVEDFHTEYCMSVILINRITMPCLEKIIL